MTNLLKPRTIKELEILQEEESLFVDNMWLEEMRRYYREIEQDKLREHLHSEDYAGGDDELYFEIYGDIWIWK